MKSKLYQAVVLLGISWGGTAAGCFGESRSRSDGTPPEPEGAGTFGRGTGGGGAGSGGAGTGAAGTGGADAVGGASGAAAGTAAETAGTSFGGALAVAGTGGSAGTGGADGSGAGGGASAGEGGAADAATGGVGGIIDAGTDAPADPFCDDTWPTTKGNPAAPPSCEDQAECGGPPNDAGFMRWLECRARLGDMQCDYTHVTSICENGKWVCPPDGLPPVECRCVGPTPSGMLCTKDGWAPLDGGAAGAPG